jgi:DNA repair protein RadC
VRPPVAAPSTEQAPQVLDSPDGVARLLSPLLTGLDREHFVVLALDARNRPIGCHTVSVGSLSASIVHPREVFKFAILANAAAVILAHNHPSGDTTPSHEDVELTRRLREAGELLGIAVLDHVVVTDGDHTSFRERGLM